MDAIEFLLERNRMCDTYHDHAFNNGWNCRNCPALDKEDRCKLKGVPHSQKEAEELIIIVEKWSKEHPIKTNLDVLKEMFPNINFKIGLEHCNGLECPNPDTLCRDCEYKGFWKKEYKEPIS